MFSTELLDICTWSRGNSVSWWLQELSHCTRPCQVEVCKLLLIVY